MWPAWIKKRAQSARRRMTGAFADRRANVAMLFGLAAVPLMGAVGLAIDGGRAYLVQNRMAKALDAAGLAAARVALSDRAAADAQRFFDANFPKGYLGASKVVVGYSTDANVDFITLSAQTTIPTVIMSILGFETLTVAETAKIQRLNRGLELALVLDTTGSMSSTQMTWLRDSANALVNILFGPDDELDTLWISVVPYTSTVNIGGDRTAWLSPADGVRTGASDFGPTSWKGCVMARDPTLGRDKSDDPPTVAPFTSFLYPDGVDNDWILEDGSYSLNTARSAGNTGRGPNLGCGIPVTPLTNTKSVVKAAIDALQPWSRGGTASNLGMVWGWRTISPRWRGAWGGTTPDSQPLDYGDPLMDKAVVLMTDGLNQFFNVDGDSETDYTGYGRLSDLGVTNRDAGIELLNNKLKDSCESMKKEGIIIYTITFGVNDEATRGVFRSCATVPEYYFNTESSSELGLYKAFRAIGQQLSNLRVVE